MMNVPFTTYLTTHQPEQGAKKVIVPFMQKFAKEPILIFGAFYNAIQVALCGYMIIGTIKEYPPRPPPPPPPSPHVCPSICLFIVQ
jgi:hypothetical protein